MLILSLVTQTRAHYSAFQLGKKMAAAQNGNIYIKFYSSNNNVRRFLQLFSVLMLFIETINYKTGPCVIRRSIKMILKKYTFSLNVDLGTCRRSPKEMNWHGMKE